jgi:MFS superfamily sulfate permease-like transporter
MLVGVTVAGMVGGDLMPWADIAALTALVFAGMWIVAGVLRPSTQVHFISETILLGFKAEAALTIALTQLPKLFGVPGGRESVFERIWILIGQLGDTNIAVLGFGLATLSSMCARWSGRRSAPPLDRYSSWSATSPPHPMSTSRARGCLQAYTPT